MTNICWLVIFPRHELYALFDDKYYLTLFVSHVKQSF